MRADDPGGKHLSEAHCGLGWLRASSRALVAVQDRSRFLAYSRQPTRGLPHGIAAGYAVEVEDLEFAYALYAGDPSNVSATRVASFREGRIGYREWARRSGRINPSLEDRLDHDVDELMA
jgi:hypothetical protein